jgi:hypothetical protein
MILYPFIGLSDCGELRIHVSPFKLYPLSPMHRRKNEFPAGCEGVIEPERIEEVLHKMQDYFKEHEARKPKKK